MEKRGYGYNDGTSKHLRKIARLPWFKNTIMVFEK